jgi:uracil-DNA glycosylase
MDWKDVLAEEKKKDYFKNIQRVLKGSSFFPAQDNIFRTLNLTSLGSVRCVILGQDPYHGGQANGLAFAVNEESDIPPSLRNIFKEIQNEYGKAPNSRTLVGWANQGVLLLNTILTVERSNPLSHKDLGWQAFTDRVIAELNSDSNPKVFLLWGKHARDKKILVTNPKHLILETTHPSPFSASYGFMGCGHFKKVNEFLKSNGLNEIDWIAS